LIILPNNLQEDYPDIK